MKNRILFLIVMIALVGSVGAQNLSEGFEGDDFPPVGWKVINEGDPNGWVHSSNSTADSHTGSGSAYIYYHATEEHDDYLICPQIMPESGDDIFSFWVRNNHSSYKDAFVVKLSTTGRDKDDFDETLLTETTPSTTYTQYDIDLSDYNGSNVFVAIVAVSVNGDRLRVDDISGPPVNIFTTWTGAISTVWNLAGNWDAGVPDATADAIIPAGLTNYPTISAAAVCNDITIEDGASLIGSENLTVSGDATMQHTIDAYSLATNGWHLLSSPVDNMDISGSDFEPGTATPNLDDFYGWDEVNYQWLNQKVVANSITNFVNGTGYLVSYETGATKDFTGTFNNSDITFTNLTSTSGIGDGWHLVGNPFQSALKWTATDWVRTNICMGAKIMNNGGSYTDITVGGTDIIPANQGFFIQATTNNSNTFTIPKSQRVHSSTAFYKNEILNFLTLKAIDGNYYQESCVQFMDGSTEAYDAEFDVRFFSGMAEAPQIYSICGEELLSTNRISTPEDETTIPFGFNTFTETTITIEALGVSSFNNEYKIVLEDLLENKLVDLQENPSYTFESKPEFASDRFLLYFKSLTGVEENEINNNFEVYSFSNNLYIENPNKLDATVVVYNVLGQEVRKMQINGDEKNKFYLNIRAGYYVVKVINSDSITTKKVYLQ